MNKILILDQATKSTGYSIWESGTLNTCGLILSDVKEENPIERMQQVYFQVKELILKENPNYVIIEGTQFQQNFRVYERLSQLQGVLFSILFELNLPFSICPPTTWKSFCEIKGRKRKEQKENTMLFIKNKFGRDVSEDEADACAIGWWAVNTLKVNGRALDRL